jgi:Zn-ribbon protein, possibly nucleic acid-binding
MADNNNLELIHNALKELQDVLKERFVLVDKIKELPKNLKAKEQALKKANAELDELTNNYNLAKEAFTSNSLKYDEAVKYRADSEKKMDEIATQREYEALSKQIDDAKVKEQSLLKAKTVSETQVGEFEQKVAEQKAICDKLSVDVATENAIIDSELADKQAQIDKLDAQCNELRKGLISDELYAKFSMIVQNKKGVGIVPVHGQVCQGCNMILPVQFVNDVRSDNQIEYCPYCSRILYYEDSVADAEMEELLAKGSGNDDAALDGYDDSEGTDIADSTDFSDLL